MRINEFSALNCKLNGRMRGSKTAYIYMWSTLSKIDNYIPLTRRLEIVCRFIRAWHDERDWTWELDFVTAVVISQIFADKLIWGDRTYYGRQTGGIRRICSLSGTDSTVQLPCHDSRIYTPTWDRPRRMGIRVGSQSPIQSTASIYVHGYIEPPQGLRLHDKAEQNDMRCGVIIRVTNYSISTYNKYI